MGHPQPALRISRGLSLARAGGKLIGHHQHYRSDWTRRSYWLRRRRRVVARAVAGEYRHLGVSRSARYEPRLPLAAAVTVPTNPARQSRSDSREKSTDDSAREQERGTESRTKETRRTGPAGAREFPDLHTQRARLRRREAAGQPLHGDSPQPLPHARINSIRLERRTRRRSGRLRARALCGGQSTRSAAQDVKGVVPATPPPGNMWRPSHRKRHGPRGMKREWSPPNPSFHLVMAGL